MQGLHNSRFKPKQFAHLRAELNYFAFLIANHGAGMLKFNTLLLVKEDIVGLAEESHEAIAEFLRKLKLNEDLERIHAA